MKNTITVQITATRQGIDRIKNTPTLNMLFAINQLKMLQADKPMQMNVSKPTYSRMMNLLNISFNNEKPQISCHKIKAN